METVTCPKCQGPTWDNRTTKKNPKQPDYKCRDKANCDGAIWLDSKKPAQGHSNTPANGNGNAHVDGRSDPAMSKDAYWTRKEQNDLAKQPRIERQHAQEMALRYFCMIEKVPDTTDKLRMMIDWFQRDVGHVPTAPARTSENAARLDNMRDQGMHGGVGEEGDFQL